MNINAGHNAMRIGVLELCGIKPVKTTSFAPVKSSDRVKRRKWLAAVEKLGKEQK